MIKVHLTLLLALAAPSAAAAISNLLSIPENVIGNHNMVVVQPTPKCWNAAIELFPEISPSIDTVTFCALLPNKTKKRLALEIARCHMFDLGKPLVHGTCQQLDDCLRSLTVEGANAYTHYITYVQQLCIRLTQELLLQQQHQIQVDIGEQYKTVSEETLAQVKSLQDSIVNHVHNLDELSNLPQRLREDLSRELQEKLADTLTQSLDRELGEHLAIQLEQQLGMQLSSLLQQQALQQASFVDGILDNLNQRDQQLQERFKLWEHYQTSLWSNHAMEVEKQRRQIEEQRNRMEYLSTTLTQATHSLWPLEGFKAVVKFMSGSYAWLATGMHFLMHMLVLAVMTRPRRCHAFRIHLFQLTILEALLELMLQWVIQNAVVTNEASADMIGTIRLGFRVAAILLYLFGITSSLFRPSNKKSFPTPDHEWQMPRNEPLVYYYHHPVPPIPPPVPFTAAPRGLTANTPRPLDQKRLQQQNHPSRDGALAFHSPIASSAPATIFRAAPTPLAKEAVQLQTVSPHQEEEITPPPASSFDQSEQEVDGEMFHDARDPAYPSGRKRKSVLFAEEEEEHITKKSKK